MKIIEHMTFTLTDFPREFYEGDEIKKALEEIENQKRKILKIVPSKYHPLLLKELSRLSDCHNHYFTYIAEEYFRQGMKIGKQLFEEINK